MGEYGGYVWSAFAVTGGLLILHMISVWIQFRNVWRSITAQYGEKNESA